jgi:uncharacterized protein YqcC (DUF446 family)
VSLHLVADNGPLTADHLADLEWLAHNVLIPGMKACRELTDAMAARDREAAMLACRRIATVGVTASDRARQMERER